MNGYNDMDMRLMGGVPGQQLFLYRTEDDVATVTSPGYFDQAVEDYNLDTGDIIIATTGVDRANAVSVLVARVDGNGTVSVVG